MRSGVAARPEVAALSVRCIADGHVDPSAVGVLADVDAMTLEAADRVELIRAWERVKAMVDAMQQDALASVIEATEGAGLDGDLARHEVGAALRLSPLTASRRTRNAADLVRRLPATLAQLRAGRISYLQASHLAEEVRELPDDLATQVETRVLAKAWDQTLAETKRQRSGRSSPPTVYRRWSGSTRPSRNAPSTGCRWPTRWKRSG